ncbi:MAG: hypothetical protein ACXWUU_04410 [Burkholderiales bacterium]
MAKRVMEFNIKADMPSVGGAKRRLIARIAEAQRSGTAVLKVIHGYGSSGVGGKLRVALRKTLERLASEGRLRRIVHGENWDIFDETTQGLLGDYAELSGDEDLGQHNAGITIVELRRKQV